MKEKLYFNGFKTFRLSDFKILGKWKPNQNSFKIKLGRELFFCVPAYAINKEFNQLRLSKNHTFWIRVNKRWQHKLNIRSSVFSLTATQLGELIDQINYLKNLEKKYFNNNYKENSKNNWFTNLVFNLKEKILNILLKSCLHTKTSRIAIPENFFVDKYETWHL